MNMMLLRDERKNAGKEFDKGCGTLAQTLFEESEPQRKDCFRFSFSVAPYYSASFHYYLHFKNAASRVRKSTKTHEAELDLFVPFSVISWIDVVRSEERQNLLGG
jgi:hypothetical protein